MADDPELTERVRRALRDERDVVERRMFGSIGFMVGGVLRVGVGRHSDHVMMARVPEAQQDWALTEPGVRPAVMRGKPLRGWLYFGEEAVATDEQLHRWVEAALAAEV
jgi:TfoX N-terminal domain